VNLDVNHALKTPLYYQLKEELRKDILRGVFKEGDLIPSEREFAEKYRLSSTTIRRALNDLVHEDLLERKAGKGTFVRKQMVRRDLKKVLGFTANMMEMGLTPSTKVLNKEVVSADSFAREKMGLRRGAKVALIKRLRLANEIPMMLETRYIREDICPGILRYDLASSLWEVFEKRYGYKPHRHSQHLGVSYISGEPAKLLGLEDGSVVFLIRGVTYIKDGRAIECEESLYRSDKYDLAFDASLE
jgi:GntR family transcriptional regulator